MIITKDDVISRQAAIDAINHELRCGAVIDQCGLETAHDLIKDLPSAQPQQWIPVTKRLPNEDEIIYNGVGINGERKVSDRVCAIDSDGFIRCGYFQKSCMEHEYWGNGRKNEYSETGIATWEFGDRWECDPNQWIVTVSKSIIAWCPLPEPWKGESDERI